VLLDEIRRRTAAAPPAPDEAPVVLDQLPLF
jgi:hypothetical protein